MEYMESKMQAKMQASIMEEYYFKAKRAASVYCKVYGYEEGTEAYKIAMAAFTSGYAYLDKD